MRESVQQPRDANIAGLFWFRRRNVWITLFVVAWMSLFHYETLRLRYLSPLAGRELPKLKWLYPPAGWIMFFNVDRAYGFAEVYGFREGRPVRLDPHEIFRTRFVLYDNIRRNVLITTLDRDVQPRFCRYLKRKFPQYDGFYVMAAFYPSNARLPEKRRLVAAYEC